MRALLLSLAFGLIGAALTPPLARAAGAYVIITQSNATACARACTNDGLCVAWFLRAGQTCALSANVPADWPADAADAGLSHRAPAFATLPERPLAVLADEASSAFAADPAYALLGGPDGDALRQHLRADQ